VQSWGSKINGLSISITFKNGSTLNFGTNEQGALAHQGQRCNLIIYDEEPDFDVFEEGSARMSREGKAPRQLFTMTPTKGKGWVWDELIQRRHERKVVYETCAIFENGTGTCVACDTPRAKWDAILRNLHLNRDPADSPIQGGRWLNLQLQAADDETVSLEEGFCHRCWTFGMQPFSEPDFVLVQIANNRSNRKRVAMRLLGSWENLDGSALFDADKLAALKAHCREPRTSDHMSLQTWEPPRPRNPYVIGVDPARGVGRDETVFQVINAATGVQAAVWGNNDIKWTEYITDLAVISKRYWKAMAIVELNKGEGLAYGLERDHPEVPQFKTARRLPDGTCAGTSSSLNLAARMRYTSQTPKLFDNWGACFTMRTGKSTPPRAVTPTMTE
jgi:phage terminase large subunit-like protein